MSYADPLNGGFSKQDNADKRRLRLKDIVSMVFDKPGMTEDEVSARMLALWGLTDRTVEAMINQLVNRRFMERQQVKLDGPEATPLGWGLYCLENAKWFLEK